jgi:hypothetical protein
MVAYTVCCTPGDEQVKVDFIGNHQYLVPQAFSFSRQAFQAAGSLFRLKGPVQ